MNRREFIETLAVAAAAGLPLHSRAALSGDASFYDIPRFGNVSLLHYTDCHAQLLPVHFREPNVNLGVGNAIGKPPHLVGEHLLKAYGIKPQTPEAHAFTYLDFEAAARSFGKLGGFAHLATLVKRLRASRPGALLLDGGDAWQGSATALWSKGQDMVDATKLLGVDIMTGHWEFTYGEERVKDILELELKGKIEFLAQNVHTADFGDPVFKSHAIREINGVPVAIIGQAFPYTPIANPRYFVPNWTFGIKEVELQKVVDQVRGKGAKAIVLLSHNGMDVDLKLASRVTGIDVILGGHTHDAVPISIDDMIDTTLTVPAIGAFRWDVNPSTRPFETVGKTTTTVSDTPVSETRTPQKQTTPWLTDDPQGSQTGGAKPDSSVENQDLRVDSLGRLVLTLSFGDPTEDYDLALYKRNDDGSIPATPVATSGNPNGQDESIDLANPADGDYVVQVTNYYGPKNDWSLKVDRYTKTTTTTPGARETYTLTCEIGGNVVKTSQIYAARGDLLNKLAPCRNPKS